MKTGLKNHSLFNLQLLQTHRDLSAFELVKLKSVLFLSENV